jgi:hypothetical protein
MKLLTHALSQDLNAIQIPKVCCGGEEGSFSKMSNELSGMDSVCYRKDFSIGFQFP